MSTQLEKGADEGTQVRRKSYIRVAGELVWAFVVSVTAKVVVEIFFKNRD